MRYLTTFPLDKSILLYLNLCKEYLNNSTMKKELSRFKNTFEIFTKTDQKTHHFIIFRYHEDSFGSRCIFDSFNAIGIYVATSNVENM